MPNPFSDDTIVDDNPSDVSLSTLVGEGQKYKTPDELANAYVHADAYIERLKAEKAALEAEAKVQRDLLEARLNQNTKTPDAPANQDRHEDKPDPQTPTNDKVDVSKLVRDELAAANAEQRKADNINAAADVMTKRYGSPAKAQEAIRNRAAELGVGFEFLRDTAATSPALFYSSMGISPDDRSASTPSYNPSVRLPVDQGAGQRNFSYYEDMRKKNPKVFYSNEIRAQMFKDRTELGDKFFNR